ncbi:ATP-binding protein [Cognatiyoonia koreensis]|uniref:ATP-binding protein n=1 Tax=Cognatiyoonia koreensis TaxID=364200 RepID=UPI0031012DAD
MLDAELIETLPFPVLVIGDDQMIAATNATSRQLLGDHVVGRHFSTALRQPALLDRIEAVMANGAPLEASYLGREAGRDTTYTVHIASAGQAVVLTFQDRTAAEDIYQFRTDFVANVSHELRTPLTALLGFIETLRGPARDDAAARDRFLEVMAREAGRMARLVDDLLSLSRLEAKERVRPSGSVVLANVAQSALAELQPVTDAAGATIRFEDQSGGANIAAEAGELRQVIANLIENAVKYSEPGSEIALSLNAPAHEARLRGVGVRLVVRDAGFGIAPHHIARLTERFYRVDNHRSREVGGTGLGLAIVKHIVNRHRGRLLIESIEGEGTTVTVILPVLDDQ